MKHRRIALCVVLAALSGVTDAAGPAHGKTHPPSGKIRVAVVGGLVLCGVWPALAKRAHEATGLEIETVAAAPKEGVVPVFRSGKADLLIIHGSDESYALQAAGLAAPLRAWAMNEHVLVGPRDDPARVGETANGVDAVRRIVTANAALLGFRDPGSFSIVHALFKTAGIRPGARQQLFDDAETPQLVLRSAAAKGAYAVVGHIPVAFGKMPNDGLAVLLKGDRAMRRIYVIVEPGTRHPAGKTARQAARRLADYLVSPRGQAALIAADRSIGGGPWIFPLDDARQP